MAFHSSPCEGTGRSRRASGSGCPTMGPQGGVASDRRPTLPTLVWRDARWWSTSWNFRFSFFCSRSSGFTTSARSSVDVMPLASPTLAWSFLSK